MDTRTCTFVITFMQMKTAIEDFEYTKWLDPAESALLRL